LKKVDCSKKIVVKWLKTTIRQENVLNDENFTDFCCAKQFLPDAFSIINKDFKF
jgi:hypothetical protein